MSILELWDWMISSYRVPKDWKFVCPQDESQPLDSKTH